MNRPVRTGFLFGLGFVVVFVVLGIALEYAAEYVVDKVIFSSVAEAQFDEPVVSSVAHSLSGSRVVVLAELNNPNSHAITFQAEAALRDSGGALLDICSGERRYTVDASDSVGIKIVCVGDGNLDAIIPDIESVDLQFYDEY